MSLRCTEGRSPGQWHGADAYSFFEITGPNPKAQRRTAHFYCPACGWACSLVNHTIADDGVVTPSAVECKDAVRCGKTHENLILDGWKP